MTLRNLGKRLDVKIQAIASNTGERTNRAAVAMVRTLALSTPVDTSQALSNWIVGIGSPDPSFIGPWVPGEAGSTRAQSAAEAVKVAELMLRSRKPGIPFFITNNAPYIQLLEDETHSRQPGRFVAKGQLAFKVAMREGKRK